MLGPQEILDYLCDKGIIIGDSDNLKPRAILKVSKKENGVFGKIFQFDDIPVDRYEVIIDSLEKIKIEINAKIDRAFEWYNYLIRDGIRLRLNISDCQTEEEYRLNEVATLLWKHRPFIREKIASGTILVEETTEQKIERLKREVGYYGFGYKPRTRNEIPYDSDYGKWCELLRLINLGNKRKERSRNRGNMSYPSSDSVDQVSRVTQELPKQIDNPNFIMEICSSSSHIAIPKSTNETLSISSSEQVNFQTRDEIITPNFIMEICPPTYQCKSSCATSSDTSTMITTPNFTIEILPSEGSERIQSFHNHDIPDDSEAETDPLNIITWPDYYNADRCIRTPDPISDLTPEDWNNIEKVYKSLADAKFNHQLDQFNRETFLLDMIVSRYNELHRRLPKIPKRKPKTNAVDAQCLRIANTGSLQQVLRKEKDSTLPKNNPEINISLPTFANFIPAIEVPINAY